MKTKAKQCLTWLMLPLICFSLKAFALEEAILDGDEQKAIQEIFLSSDINALYKGQSALHLATERGFLKVVTVLLINGAQINLLSAQGETAADIALDINNKEILKLLIDKNGIFNIQTHTLARASMELRDILKSAELRELFPFICPLFFDDIILFQTLINFVQAKEFPAWIVADVLASLAAEAFPSGAPNADALQEIDHLLSIINGSDILKTKITASLQMLSREKEIPVSFAGKRENPQNEFEKKELARALTIKEHKLFKILTTWNFADWILDENAKEAIDKYLQFSKNTEAILTFFIERKKSIKEKNREAKKILKLGREFLKLNNFSGLKIVASVIAKQTELKTIKLTTNQKEELTKFTKIVSPEGNYSKYREHVAKLSSLQPFMPILEIYLGDLRSYFNKNKQLLNREYLIKIALTLKELNGIKRRDIYAFDKQNNLDRILDGTPFNAYLKIEPSEESKSDQAPFWQTEDHDADS